jgi:hypothetical protein
MPTLGAPGLFPAWRAHGHRLGHNRRLRRIRLRAWHLLRHHYLTFVSGAIFAGVVVTLFTSSSFGVDEAPHASAGPDELDSSSDALSSSAAASPASTDVMAYHPRPRSYPVIYYLVDSKEQQLAMKQAIESDSARRVRQGPGDPANAEREVLLITTPEEERQATVLILDVAYAAAAEGVAVMVVDTR